MYCGSKETPYICLAFSTKAMPDAVTGSQHNTHTKHTHTMLHEKVELHNGEIALESDAVELHDGQYALNEDCIELHDGQYALREECVQLYNGDFALESDTIELFGQTFLEDDSDIYTTHCGDRFHESQMNRQDIVWVDEDDVYAYRRDTTHGITEHGYGTWVTEDHSEVYIQGDYYISDSVAERNGYVYCNEEDEWMSQDEYNQRTIGLANYHSLPRIDKRQNVEGWAFGLEVEKEDHEVLTEIKSNELHTLTGWCKERDASLCDSTGFEAVSPIYGLHEKVWEEDFENEYIKNILNADGSNNCGGHFNLSSTEYNPAQIANGLSGFFPLLYAMWSSRLLNDFCLGKKKNEMLYSRSKRSAIHIHSNRIEFRIFGRIKSVQNAKFRINFVKLMVANINKSEAQILSQLLNVNSALHKLLRKVYSLEELQKKIALFVLYSEEYNDIKLKYNPKWISSEPLNEGQNNEDEENEDEDKV